MLSRDDVEAVLRSGNYEGGYLGVFAQETHEALHDWHLVVGRSPKQMENPTPLERATFLNRRIVERICMALDGDPRVAIYDTDYGNKLLTVDSAVTIRCKKLNHDLRAMNIRTARVEQLWYENQPMLSRQFEDWINVTYGWQLSSSGAINELAIINEYQDALYWFISLGDIGASTMPRVQLPFPPVAPNSEMPYIMTVRDTERARRAAADNSDRAANADEE